MSFGQRRLAPVAARFALEHPKLRVILRLEGRERSPLTLSVLYPSRQHVPARTRLFTDHRVEQLAQAGGRAAALRALT